MCRPEAERRSTGMFYGPPTGLRVCETHQSNSTWGVGNFVFRFCCFAVLPFCYVPRCNGRGKKSCIQVYFVALCACCLSVEHCALPLLCPFTTVTLYVVVCGLCCHSSCFSLFQPTSALRGNSCSGVPCERRCLAKTRRSGQISYS